MRPRAASSIGTILAALALATGATAAEAEAKAKGWDVSRTGVGCVAVLNGPDADMSIRLLRSHRPQRLHETYLSIWLDDVSVTNGIRNFQLSIAGADAPLAEGALVRNRNTGKTIAIVSLQAAQVDALAKAGRSVTLVIAADGEEITRLETEAFSSAQAAFEPCLAEVGEEQMAARSPNWKGTPGPHHPAPKNNPGRWIMPHDYPTSEFRTGVEGVTTVRLTVNRYGFVARCDVTESTASPALDRTTCRALSGRAIFYPARDEDDQATEGTFSQSVRWQLPETP